MACGTPVIVSNVSSLPEVVENAGILVNPNDYNVIENNLVKMINDRKLWGSLLWQMKRFHPG